MIALIKKDQVSPVKLFTDWHKAGNWADANITKEKGCDPTQYSFDTVAGVKEMAFKILVRFNTCCPKCKSKTLNEGHWIRGWNDELNQACGDNGTRCFDCGHIQWEQSFKEYVRKLPVWCRAYND